jgi:hypothetical protein
MAKIHHFKYTYELKGFKKAVSANSFWLNVEVFLMIITIPFKQTKAKPTY